MPPRSGQADGEIGIAFEADASARLVERHQHEHSGPRSMRSYSESTECRMVMSFST